MSMRTITIFLFAISLLFAPFDARSEETETMDELLARIEQVPERNLGTSPRESAYINKLVQFQPDVIPKLISLLTHEDKPVAELAAVTLCRCDSIDAKYLPDIMAGLERGLYLGYALSSIDDERAVEETINRYLHLDSPEPHEVQIVAELGQKVLPYIIQTAIAHNGEGEFIYLSLALVLEEMNTEAKKEAALSLQKILNDETSSTDLVRGVLTMVYYLGEEQGRLLETDLITLRESRPELKDKIDYDLVYMRSAISGQILAEKLRKETDLQILIDTAWIGKPAAKDAGPEVLKLLNYSDWKIRRAAAMTLGCIEYQEAIPELIDLLGDSQDVIINWIAANSLGRIHAAAAQKALTETAKNHWHPAVRREAEKALQYMQTSTPYAPARTYDYYHFRIDDQELTNCVSSMQSSTSKLYKATSPKLMEKLQYDAKINSPGRPVFKQIPDVAIRVEEGWITGNFRGEFGGELMFIGDTGIRYILLHENTHDLYTIGDKKIAITGAAVWTSNYGMVYELLQTEGRKWKAIRWLALPGAPFASYKTQSGEIFIATHSGGNVILSENGNMRMANQ